MLAELAETAHGLQGEELRLIKTKDGKLELKSEEAAEGEDVILDVFTKGQRAPMVRPEKVVLQLKGEPEERLDMVPGADALFWTVSAVEKFLLPYYHAQRILTPDEMADLMKKIAATELVAILHVAPSKSNPRPEQPIQIYFRGSDGKARRTGLSEFMGSASPK